MRLDVVKFWDHGVRFGFWLSLNYLFGKPFPIFVVRLLGLLEEGGSFSPYLGVSSILSVVNLIWLDFMVSLASTRTEGNIYHIVY